MKYFKEGLNIRKHLFIIGIIVVVILAAVVIAGYIDVNSRFPQPEQDIAEKGEWIDYAENIKLNVSDIDYCSDTELNQKYKADVKENGKYDYIVVKMNLNNESDTNYNLINLISKTNLVIYPSGYENQGDIVGNDINVISGETKEFTLYFTVSKMLIKKKGREKLLGEDIYVCFKAYPKRQAVVFRGIDG